MSEYIYGSSLKAAKSKANYLFDGDFRRRPAQNLSGASRSLARVDLLQRASQQRQTREDDRRKADAALKLQINFRGYRARSTLAAKLRDEFDVSTTNILHNRSLFNREQFDLLSRSLIQFYHSEHDEQRLRSFISLMMQHQDVVLISKKKDSEIWCHRMARLLSHSLFTMKQILTLSHDELSTHLKFFQTFTSLPEMLNESEASRVWCSLIKNAFFPTMRNLYHRNIDLDVALELIRRSLDTDPQQSRSCDETPAYRFLEQFLLEPDVDEEFMSKLLELRPRHLEAKWILQAFVESSDYVRSRLLTHGASQFGINQSQPQDIEACKEITRLCYIFLKSLCNRIDGLNESDKIKYINVISILLEPAEYITTISLIQVENQEDVDQSEDDELAHLMEASSRYQQLMNHYPEIHLVIKKIFGLINQLSHINSLKSLIFSESSQNQIQDPIVKICNLMISHEQYAIFNCRLLYTVAFSKEFTRSLWRTIVGATSPSVYMSSTPIHTQIARSSPSISRESYQIILPRLKLFCSLCSYLLPTIDDDEFYTSEENRIYSVSQDEQPKAGTSASGSSSQTVSGSEANSSISSFYVDKELVGIIAILRDMSVGLVEIIYRGNKQTILQKPSSMRIDNMGRIVGIGTIESQVVDEKSRLLSFEIKSTFQALIRILGQLHARDSRKPFCPPGHWICPTVTIPSSKTIDFQLATIQQGRLLDQMNRDDRKSEHQLSERVSSEVKTVLILQEIPFVIAFHDRVKIFQKFLAKERGIWRGERYNFGQEGSYLPISVRRTHIYEDAFEKLASDKEPNVKLPFSVTMIDELGLREDGMDGGGLSKEFLTDLIKSGFDPMRGFFKYTNDNFLYPNPSAKVLFANLNEGFQVHYDFLGRMLGKAILDKVMVELPLASFFLAKLLAVQNSSEIDLHNLESLDPVLYKNLNYLKNYKGDVSELGLDFTISNNDLDEHEVLELKPGGSKIAVTKENKIEYVHLLADYRLNKQIRLQCAAFKRGLAKLIDLEWLRMFDSRELQILIAGAPTSIDVDDWRRHTTYAHGYSDDSPAVRAFWAAVSKMDESLKRKLLKFSTSCSLPPLLGFKDLHPPFYICPSEEDRLPTSATCYNLLRLPQIEDEETMRAKILYAIESNAGFGLA